MDKLIIQVAMNERVTRAQNPHVPLTPEELAQDAIDCCNAGASIVHFHPRDPRSGENRPSDVGLYRDALRRIRAKSDVIFYPTAGYSPDIDADLAHVRELAASPDRSTEMYLQGIGAWSTGSWDAAQQEFSRDSAYVVPHSALRPFLAFARDQRFKVVMMAHELGHMRSILMLREAGLLPGPLVLQLNFSENQAFGPTPDAAGIQAYLGMLPAGLAAQWFVQVIGGAAHHRVNALALAMGGHPRIGIGDLAPEADGPLSNAKLVERIAAQARALGRSVATPAEARELIGIPALPRCGIPALPAA
jgi:3-keto-5-aminohexanoate cleavage enzyme